MTITLPPPYYSGHQEPYQTCPHPSCVTAREHQARVHDILTRQDERERTKHELQEPDPDEISRMADEGNPHHD